MKLVKIKSLTMALINSTYVAHTQVFNLDTIVKRSSLKSNSEQCVQNLELKAKTVIWNIKYNEGKINELQLFTAKSKINYSRK